MGTAHKLKIEMLLSLPQCTQSIALGTRDHLRVRSIQHARPGLQKGRGNEGAECSSQVWKQSWPRKYDQDRVIDNVYRDECPSVYHRTGGPKSSTAPEPTSLLTCSVITDMMFSLSLLALRGTKTILSQMRGSLLVLMHRRGDLTAWKAHKIQR